MAKAKYEGPPEALALYEEVVSRLDAVDRKGAANPYTSRNGHMFSFLDREGIVSLHLSPDDLTEFLSTYDSGPSIQHGRTMNGYATVPADLLENTDQLAGWFERSHDWIGTLKPKPTKRKKPTPKKKA